jgi:uncharacterized protein (DUF2062 family)
MTRNEPEPDGTRVQREFCVFLDLRDIWRDFLKTQIICAIFGVISFQLFAAFNNPLKLAVIAPRPCAIRCLDVLYDPNRFNLAPIVIAQPLRSVAK